MNQKKNKSITPNKNFFIASTLIILLVISLGYALRPAKSSNQYKPRRLSANPNSQIDPSVKTWFSNYDEIRRQAQLSPAERQRADQIMGRGLSLFLPGGDKSLAQNLMTDLVSRYEVAAQQLSQLHIVPATEQLHRAYYQYFIDARNLFSDYLKLQADLMAVDPNTGQPIASGLVERKENLALLDQNNKVLDEKLRQQYNIAPYQYQLPSQSQQSAQHQQPLQN